MSRRLPLFEESPAHAPRRQKPPDIEPVPLVRAAWAVTETGGGTRMLEFATAALEAWSRRAAAPRCAILAVEAATAFELKTAEERLVRAGAASVVRLAADDTLPDRLAQALAACDAHADVLLLGNPIAGVVEPRLTVLLGIDQPRPRWLPSAAQIASRADVRLPGSGRGFAVQLARLAQRGGTRRPSPAE